MSGGTGVILGMVITSLIAAMLWPMPYCTVCRKRLDDEDYRR